MPTASVLSEHTYSRLRDMVLNGTWRSGESLSERELAAKLKVSRMPVREALRKLQHDGLLDIVPFRGAFIRKLTAAEVRDIYEVRQAVEGMAAFLAARGGGASKLAPFRALFSELPRTTAAALRKSQQTGAAFHTAIIEISGNAKLLAIAESLRTQIVLTLNMALKHDPERVRLSIAEHLSILDAIERRDASEARERMVAHLASGLESRLHILTNLR
ncbi:MAG TPA: GntR family transcriptional regulator [Casimicrobiaceae bacterium]|nr:GntR family transcriptional regulator [Casimicrobiaceae bacterium]